MDRSRGDQPEEDIVSRWLEVINATHEAGLKTAASWFGHIETRKKSRICVKLRELG